MRCTIYSSMRSNALTRVIYRPLHSVFHHFAHRCHAVWTQAEDDLAVQLRREGKSPRDIAAQLPGRSANGVKARILSALRRKLDGHIRPPTDQGAVVARDKLIGSLVAQNLSWDEILQSFPGKNQVWLSKQLTRVKRSSQAAAAPGYWTQEKDEELLRLRREQGLNYKQIARRMNKKLGTVYRRFIIIAAENEPRIAAKRSQKYIPEIIRLRNCGHSFADIGGILNVPEVTVNRWFDKAEKAAGKYTLDRRWRRWSKEDDRNLINYAGSGIGDDWPQIAAERLGRTHASVLRRWQGMIDRYEKRSGMQEKAESSSTDAR